MNTLADEKLGKLLASLASKTPAPGGGAAAGVIGATAAALGGMVLSFSIGKKSLAEHEEHLQAAIQTLEAARVRFLSLADEDAAAYAELNRLQKRDKDDPARLADEPAALQRAINAPADTQALALDVLIVLETLVGCTNRYLASDLAIAGVAAEAAVVAGGWNVRINAEGLEPDARAEALERVETANLTARAIRDRIESACMPSS